LRGPEADIDFAASPLACAEWHTQGPFMWVPTVALVGGAA